MKTQQVKFSEVPNNSKFLAYLNPNQPKDCHTLPCFKNSDGSVFNREFSNLKLNPEEPVLIYLK